ASPAEIERNPRARSAKLRVAMRSAAPARPVDPALLELARLPVPKRRR
ncbi:MAG: 16S rRNA (cytosine(1402)-N(4))-methyltransferase, partial [Methylovirgula sp.]